MVCQMGGTLMSKCLNAVNVLAPSGLYLSTLTWKRRYRVSNINRSGVECVNGLTWHDGGFKTIMNTGS